MQVWKKAVRQKKPNTRSRVEKLVRFNDKNDDHSTKRYVTNKFELSLVTLSPDGHLPEWREQRNSCMWCKYLVKKMCNKKNENENNEKKTPNINNNMKAPKNPPQSQIYCIKCNVPLCCSKGRSDCFKDYHTRKEENN